MGELYNAPQMEPQIEYEQQESLASELLSEVKESAKRWFIAFLTVLFFWFTTIAVFFWYITLPVEESTVKIESEGGGNANYIGDDGDIINGENNSFDEAESGTET